MTNKLNHHRTPTKAVPRLLITAGPTQEPIDAVRFIGNRSSGRLGVELADAAAKRGWHVTLCLGPTHLTPTDSHIELLRFRTTTELQGLLRLRLPICDVLVMAAAVADYRPIAGVNDGTGKLRRTGDRLVLDLEPTPDLLALCAGQRTPGQVLVGFALEPSARLLESAREKLARKRVDLIVANPLETMDAPTIEAVLVPATGPESRTSGPITKAEFAEFLLNAIEGIRQRNPVMANAHPNPIATP